MKLFLCLFGNKVNKGLIGDRLSIMLDMDMFSSSLREVMISVNEEVSEGFCWGFN